MKPRPGPFARTLPPGVLALLGALLAFLALLAPVGYLGRGVASGGTGALAPAMLAPAMLAPATHAGHGEHGQEAHAGPHCVFCTLPGYVPLPGAAWVPPGRTGEGRPAAVRARAAAAAHRPALARAPPG